MPIEVLAGLPYNYLKKRCYLGGVFLCGEIFRPVVSVFFTECKDGARPDIE